MDVLLVFLGVGWNGGVELDNGRLSIVGAQIKEEYSLCIIPINGKIDGGGSIVVDHLEDWKPSNFGCVNQFPSQRVVPVGGHCDCALLNLELVLVVDSFLNVSEEHGQNFIDPESNAFVIDLQIRNFEFAVLEEVEIVKDVLFFYLSNVLAFLESFKDDVEEIESFFRLFESLAGAVGLIESLIVLKWNDVLCLALGGGVLDDDEGFAGTDEGDFEELCAEIDSNDCGGYCES